MGKLEVSFDDSYACPLEPNLYGHFIEHLGRCIYEGIWVGERSEIPNTRGIRSDVVAALRKMKAPVIRWPGGCFADDYHWRDGIGPREDRPRRLNYWWGGEEPNHFGTHEFIDLCRQVGAEPYVCLNVGSGSPAEAAAWMEYCNYGGQTTLARQRAANGHPEPFGVRYWGVGNENWGCGGRFAPEDYAREYRRFACYLRGRSGGVELIACGHTTADWNHRFLEALGDLGLLDHLSIHRYYNCGAAVEFSEAEYYNLYARALEVEADIVRAAATLGAFNRTGRKIGIVVDEWGVWHPEARRENGLFQRGTLRDALVAASVLDAFHRQAHRLSMANIAQAINVLQAVCQTDGEAMWLTPTWHVFEFYKSHGGNLRARCEFHGVGTIEARGADGRVVSLPMVSASASFDRAGRRVVLTIHNRHLAETVDVRVKCPGVVERARGRVLTSQDVRDHNSRGAPRRVRPGRIELEVRRRGVVVVLPPHSLVVMTVLLKGAG